MTLPVVTWLWRGEKVPFNADYVNRLRRMLARHLRLPHELHCVTDVPDGIEDGVVIHPMYTDHAEMRAGSRACFRRLALLDRAAAGTFGPRFLQVDLDVVLVDDVTPVLDRPEPLVMCQQASVGGRYTYNPSLMLLDAGYLHDAWAEFHAAPEDTWRAAQARSWACSDMSVINHYLDRHKIRPAAWTLSDGVATYWRDCMRLRGALPRGARAVLFYGAWNPSDASVQNRSPWVEEHWR